MPLVYMLYIQEFYDLEAQLFRADYYSDGQFYLPTGPFTYIQDFNLETQYTINRQLQNCSINPIKPEKSFDAVVEDGVARLASPSDYLLLSNEFNYSYEGVSTVRGVEVESWISYREFEELATVNLTDTIYEIFFTRPGWKLETLTSAADTADSTLWRLKLTGTITFVNSSTNLTQTQNFSSTYDFFGFSSGAPDLDVFDTSVCFPPSEYYIVTMLLPVDNVQVDFSQLRRNVRSSVSSFTNVRPLQIGNIQVTLIVLIRVTAKLPISLHFFPSCIVHMELFYIAYQPDKHVHFQFMPPLLISWSMFHHAYATVTS